MLFRSIWAKPKCQKNKSSVQKNLFAAEGGYLAMKKLTEVLMIGLRTVSHAFGLMARNALIATLEKRSNKVFLGPKFFFERKIVDFPFKKELRSDRFSPRTSFERSEKQCVIK